MHNELITPLHLSDRWSVVSESVGVILILIMCSHTE